MPARLHELAVQDGLGLVRHLVHERRRHERGDDRGPGRDERPQVLHAFRRGRDDHHPPARRDAVQRRHRGCRASQPHAGQIVAGEELVRLGGAGRHHDALGAHLHELALACEGHARPVEQAERGVTFHDLDRRVRPDARLERPDRVERRTRCDAGADRELVAQQHAFAVHRGLERGGQTGDPGPDHDRVAPDVPRDGARGRRVRGQRSRTRRAADHAFGRAPREPGTDERLQVEPDRHQRVREIRDVEQVVLGRRPAPWAFDPHAARRGGDARSDARNAVDRHRAVRALAGPAVQAAPAMTLQRARERSNAGTEQRRGHRVALEHRDLAPLEPQPARRHPIRLVRVSRVSTNQVRQPSAWNQRSRCGPSTLPG